MSAFPVIAPGLFSVEGGEDMALYAQIPTNMEKIIQSIAAREWQLNQDIPEKDRRIFAQTLEAYKAALAGSPEMQKEIIT
mgnify:CR=1 FL=1